MFKGKRKGTVVMDTEDSRDKGYCVGHKSKRWICHEDALAWEDCRYVGLTQRKHKGDRMNARVHREEMIRFAESEEGVEVYYRCENSSSWSKARSPAWDKTCKYIVGDKYAKLRMESEDTGRPIQIIGEREGEWETPQGKLEFMLPPEYYRVKPEKFEYPIYKEHKFDHYIVKFTDLTVGEVVRAKPGCIIQVGYVGRAWAEHTKTSQWDDCVYEEPTYYYQWERLFSSGTIAATDWVTDEHANRNNFKENDWRKVKGSKRTWEE